MKTTLRYLGVTCILFVLVMAQAMAHDGEDHITGKATTADWHARIPILIACIVIVIGINAMFVVPALRKLREGDESMEPGA